MDFVNNSLLNPELSTLQKLTHVCIEDLYYRSSIYIPRDVTRNSKARRPKGAREARGEILLINYS